jgi:hypothetical protein
MTTACPRADILRDIARADIRAVSAAAEIDVGIMGVRMGMTAFTAGSTGYPVCMGRKIFRLVGPGHPGEHSSLCSRLTSTQGDRHGSEGIRWSGSDLERGRASRDHVILGRRCDPSRESPRGGKYDCLADRKCVKWRGGERDGKLEVPIVIVVVRDCESIPRPASAFRENSAR